ncbi:MAG TPA: GlcNAc-transferase family protein [Ramlibacter sp.]|nr:GlcNAc-transferase family protein [Ramlibacter sp.]
MAVQPTALSPMRVFVSIASYCDPVLGFTLTRALATARWPDRLHFGVVDQSPGSAAGPTPQDLAPARLSYIRIDPVYARGPCWARAIAMSLYDGEDWFFQVDSHMDFEARWDDRLITQAQALLPGRAGVVLSAYPNAFVFDAGRPVHKPSTQHILAHVVKDGALFEPGHPVLGFEAHPLERDEPVAGFHLGAGCLFAPGSFVPAFPYDPWFYFHGEEQALAARLFTHGWDIFHIPALPVWHLYNNADSGAAPRPMHWDAALDGQRVQTWWTLEQRSRERLATLLAGGPLGIYGLGRRRTMADYAAFSGIDYARRSIEGRAYRPQLLAAPA